MDNTAETRAALHSLVEEQQKRELPPADWMIPLQDIMNNGSLFNEVAKRFPHPLVVFRMNGVLEMANDKFLQETGATDDDIKAGRVNILGGSSEFVNAVTLSLKMQTTIVTGLERQLEEYIPSDREAEPGEYKSAVVFPVWDNSPVLRGAALFLPMEI